MQSGLRIHATSQPGLEAHRNPDMVPPVTQNQTTPASDPSLVDLGFLDARIKAIDIAAFLDRVQRHGQGDDYRVAALKKALPELLSDDAGRARRLLESLSDPSEEPIPAATIQGAFGAPNPDTKPTAP
jgi:hypothetical protein